MTFTPVHVRRGQKQHSAGLPCQGLAGRVGGVRRRAQQVFGEQPAQALADRHQGPLAQAEGLLQAQLIQHLYRPVGQGGGVPGVGCAGGGDPAADPGNAADPTQVPGRSGRVAQCPHPRLGHLLGQPGRPERVLCATAAPRAEGIATEAMDEDHVHLASGVIAPGDLMQCAHWAVVPKLLKQAAQRLREYRTDTELDAVAARLDCECRNVRRFTLSRFCGALLANARQQTTASRPRVCRTAFLLFCIYPVFSVFSSWPRSKLCPGQPQLSAPANSVCARIAGPAPRRQPARASSSCCRESTRCGAVRCGDACTGPSAMLRPTARHRSSRSKDARGQPACETYF